MQLAADIKASSYFTADGDEAEFYLIPGTGAQLHGGHRCSASSRLTQGLTHVHLHLAAGHYPQGQAHLLRTFDYVRQTFPWWNRTREAGQARHVLVTLSDHGPGAAAFERPIFVGNGVPDGEPMHVVVLDGGVPAHLQARTGPPFRPGRVVLAGGGAPAQMQCTRGMTPCSPLRRRQPREPHAQRVLPEHERAARRTQGTRRDVRHVLARR